MSEDIGATPDVELEFSEENYSENLDLLENPEDYDESMINQETNENASKGLYLQKQGFQTLIFHVLQTKKQLKNQQKDSI